MMRSKKKIEKYHLATIYNTLKTILTSHGLIREIVVDQNTSLYIAQTMNHIIIYI